jgi:DNA processing protein
MSGGAGFAGARAGVSELALASFAAATDAHVVQEPRTVRFARFRETFDERAAREQLRAAGLRFLGRSEAGFPPLLKAIHDPPPGLFVRGGADPELLARPAMAVVGARACSAYGRQVARRLARELAGAGVVVVSGMARGVDAEAHRGALEAGGVTVAVLGCGADRDYPAAHASLAREIAERGLVVSEYGPGVEPAPWRFPARNRIIAGLCAATTVVEARERSGALITADFALEEGREVLAVPGEITAALSAGSNALLRLGATPLTSYEDALETFGIVRAQAPPPQLEPRAAAVLERVRGAAASADELARAAELGAAELAVVLTELELAGLVSVEEGIVRATG